jgi:hypothetical protein
MRLTTATSIRRAALLAAALAVTGCATTSLTTDHDERTEFGRYGSYTIAPGPVVTDGAVTAVPDQLVQKRIDASLGQELATKGLVREQPETADLIVTYTAIARDRQELIDEDFGPEPWPFNGDVWVQDYREALLTVDVRDADTRKTVWRVTTRTKNKDFHDSEFVAKVVNKAMEDFPPVASYLR